MSKLNSSESTSMNMILIIVNQINLEISGIWGCSLDLF